MKIGLFSSSVPHVRGGYRFIVDWLAEQLVEAGHQVETVYLPFGDNPNGILDQMLAFRLIDVADKMDQIITFRPPAHIIPHPNKVVWFIHHIRMFYDLWGSEYCPVDASSYWSNIRESLMRADNVGLQEARKVFSNSATVRQRLEKFNRIDSEVLYPPMRHPERFVCLGYGDEIVSICRFESHKRLHLLVEAMKHTASPVRLRLCGVGNDYSDRLVAIAREARLSNIAFELEWISEERKVEVLSHALAVAYIPVDEDSYGYPLLEAAHSRKPLVVASDGGGTLEFVNHGAEGLVVDPDPKIIADAFDRMWSDRELTRRMGEASHARIAEMGISWPHIVSRLLA